MLFNLKHQDIPYRAIMDLPNLKERSIPHNPFVS